MPEYYYPDIAFLVNFFLDYLLLLITKYVRRLGAKQRRLAISAAAGSLFGVFTTVAGAGGILLPVNFILGSMILCVIAFGKKNIKRNVLTLLICTFIMGGMLYVLSSLVTGMSTAGNSLPGKMESSTEKGIVPTAFLLSILTVTTTVLLFFLLKIRRERANTPVYPVRFCIGETSYRCMGLLDTGNSLYEPFGKKPVLLLVSPEFKIPLEELLSKMPEKARFIPYCAVGTPEGMLFGAELKKLVIETDQEEICLEGIPAVYANSGNGNFYQVILHPDFFP